MRVCPKRFHLVSWFTQKVPHQNISHLFSNPFTSYAQCRSRSLCILGIWSQPCLFESNCTVVGWSLEHILQQLVFALLDEHSKYIVQGLYIWSTSYKRLRTREDAFQSALVMSTIGSRADRRRAKGEEQGQNCLGSHSYYFQFKSFFLQNISWPP